MEFVVAPWNFHRGSVCSYRTRNHDTITTFDHHKPQNHDQFVCDSPISPIYKCDSCEFETDLKVLLDQHIDLVHKNPEDSRDYSRILNNYKCSDCDFQTFSLIVLLKHTGNTTQKGPPKSRPHATDWNRVSNKFKKCEKPENDKWHERDQCKTEPSDCSKCFRCDQCAYKTKREPNLRQHVLLKHTNIEAIKWHKCDHCPYRAKVKFYLKRHNLEKHSDPENVKWILCEHCSYKSPSKYEVRRHTISKHDVQWYECEQCSLKSKWKSDLKNHIIARHTDPGDIKWFKCGQCPFKVKRKNHLKEHVLRRHTENIEWFECEQCNYRGKTKSDLKKHRRRQHGDSGKSDETLSTKHVEKKH